MLSKITAASVVLVAASVSAQTVVNPQPPVTATQTQNVAVVQEQVTGNVLRAGAPVPVVLSEFLTTKGKHLKVGQRVQLEVAQDVLLNGRVVIPARSPVDGVLTEIRNKGMWGKSGAIHLHINSVNINGTNIRLKGDMDTRGETGTAGVVGAIVVLPVAGFFVTGTSAEMPLNMAGRAFLDQDIALAPAS
jgi:opacity protein-like surface antigen